MRTDAKIGFAIVGVLVAVLMGFFVVNSRHAKNVAVVKPASGGSTFVEPGTSSTSIVVPPVNPDPVKPDPLKPDPVKPVEPVVPGPLVTNLGNGQNPLSGNSNNGLIDPPAIDLPIKPAPTKPQVAKADPKKGPGTPGRSKTQAHDEPLASANQRRYTIRAGQTLISIASDVYGDPMAYKQILSANPGLNPSKLRVGKRILIPDPASISRRPAVVVPASDVVYPDDMSALAITAGDSYRVQSGDSLYKLAKRFLGSGRRADELYELNRDVIGASPSRLKRGMVLRLPTAAGALSDASR